MSHDKHPSFTMGTTDLTPKAVTNHQTVTSNAVAEQMVPRHVISIGFRKRVGVYVRYDMFQWYGGIGINEFRRASPSLLRCSNIKLSEL